eukprot:3000908-Prymnesium_polylepis.1
MQSAERLSPGRALSNLNAVATSVSVALALHHMRLGPRPLCLIEKAFALVQGQAAKATTPTVWLLTPLVEHAGTCGLARAARAEALLPLRCVGAASR